MRKKSPENIIKPPTWENFYDPSTFSLYCVLKWYGLWGKITWVEWKVYIVYFNYWEADELCTSFMKIGLKLSGIHHHFPLLQLSLCGPFMVVLLLLFLIFLVLFPLSCLLEAFYISFLCLSYSRLSLVSTQVKREQRFIQMIFLGTWEAKL